MNVWFTQGCVQPKQEKRLPNGPIVADLLLMLSHFRGKQSQKYQNKHNIYA